MTPAKKDRMPSPAWLLVTAAVGLAAILTILAFLQIRASRNSQIHADFTRKAQIMAATLQGSLSSYFDVLYAVKGLYDSSEKVERREFHIFVQRLLKRHAGIQALEWIPRVTRAQRPTFEASARDDGIYEFQITERQSQGTMVPAAKRSVYYPVYYVEPYIGNELALGFDLASNAERMAAIKRARESGKLTATARLTLVQEPHKQYGIIAFLPVYNRKGDPDPATGDRISLEGFVLGVFRIGEMVTAALDAFEQETIMYSLYDRTASPENQLLWRHNPQKKNKPDTTAGRPPEIKFADWWFSSEFDMGGRSWTIRFAPTTRYFARYDFWAAWAVLAGGLLFAGMIGCLLFALLKRSADLAATNSNIQTEMAERILAEKKVRASERRYRRLISNLDTGVVVHGSDTRILLANHRAQELLGLAEDQLLDKIDRDSTWNFVREDQTQLPAHEYPVNQVISTGKPLQNFVGGIYNPKTQDLVWVVVNAFPEFDEDRYLKQVVVTFWDYTQLKLAESALARRSRDLARANVEMQKQILERKLVEASLKKKQQQITKDLEVAAGIQKTLIPHAPPRIDSIRLAWSFKPCERIGGDIFNFLHTGTNHISFYMLDVCGHGVSSSLISAAASQFLLTSSELLGDFDHKYWPEETLNRLDLVFPFERFDSFFTIACLTINHADGRMTYGSAGHPPPILRHPTGALEILDAGGPVIGSGQNKGYRQEEIRLQPGDKIVLYTDGVLDLRNPTGVFFGKQRLYDALQTYGSHSAQKLVDALTHATYEFAGNARNRDDISLMVIEYG